MEIDFLWNSTGINPWSAYFQYLFVWLILFPQRHRSSQLGDDTTPYGDNKTNDVVIKKIEHFSEVLFEWFDLNYMKMNSGKSHMLFSGNDNVSANIDNHTIISENKNELLGIVLDSKLSFEYYINNFCKKQVKNSKH